jgi:hypothetical protein
MNADESHSETYFRTPRVPSPSSDQKPGEPEPDLGLRNLCLSVFICGYRGPRDLGQSNARSSPEHNKIQQSPQKPPPIAEVITAEHQRQDREELPFGLGGAQDGSRAQAKDVETKQGKKAESRKQKAEITTSQG